MILHFGYEIPAPEVKDLDCDAQELTPEEVKILKRQILRNKAVIDDYFRRIDLFVNQERYPQGEAFVEKLRKRLFLLMEENDTFRKTLWKHLATMGARTL